MKKIFIAFILLTSINLYSHAQATPAQTPPAKAKKPATTATASKSTTATPKTATTAVAPKTTAAGPTKKDGSADMRYKANKEATKTPPATVHTKKDGTADKRYKENKK
ncbi:MAG TPA: hypothetical protein VFI33_14250 [Puia sp.]|nr:hypothetical protein [Puia sp.]